MALAWGQQPIAQDLDTRVRRLAALDPQSAPIFVARRNGAVVGTGRVMPDKADESQWWLFAIAVHPEHARQGIGTALARTAIEYARQRGAQCIRSETHIDNAASIRYHERVGFRREDVITAPDGDRQVQFRMEVG